MCQLGDIIFYYSYYFLLLCGVKPTIVYFFNIINSKYTIWCKLDIKLSLKINILWAYCGLRPFVTRTYVNQLVDQRRGTPEELLPVQACRYGSSLVASMLQFLAALRTTTPTSNPRARQCGCEQLAQGCYATAQVAKDRLELAIFRSRDEYANHSAIALLPAE